MHQLQVYKVQPPSLRVADSGTVDASGDDWQHLDLEEGSLTGTASLPPGDNRRTVEICGFDFMTLETEGGTHYSRFPIRNFGLDDETVEHCVVSQASKAFQEDLVIAEAIQNRVRLGNLPRQSMIGIDRGSVQVRRMLERMVKAEQAKPTPIISGA